MRPRAALVCIKSRAGLYLAVSRKDGQWGFPGGKLEENENALDAATRECLEEAGGFPEYLDEVQPYVDYEGSYEVTTFLANGIARVCKPERGSTIMWVTRDELINNSPFSEYNKNFFEWCDDNAT